jgi:hypothetical protein
VARLAVLSAFGHFLHDDDDKEDLPLSNKLLTLAPGVICNGCKVLAESTTGW